MAMIASWLQVVEIARLNIHLDLESWVIVSDTYSVERHAGPDQGHGCERGTNLPKCLERSTGNNDDLNEIVNINNNCYSMDDLQNGL